jgi:hypothetical protein
LAISLLGFTGVVDFCPKFGRPIVYRFTSLWKPSSAGTNGIYTLFLTHDSGMAGIGGRRHFPSLEKGEARSLE